MDHRAISFADQFQTAVANEFRRRGFVNVEVSLASPLGDAFEFSVDCSKEPRGIEIDQSLIDEIFSAAATAIGCTQP